MRPGISSSCLSEEGLPRPRCLCSSRVPERGGGGLLRAAPQLLRSPPPRAGLSPAAKMVIQKEKKSCGQVVEEWKEFVWNPRTHQFMGRTGTSWGTQGGPHEGRGGGPPGDARGAPGPAGLAPAPFPGPRRPAPLPSSGLGGGRIAGLISRAGRCGGGESRSLPPSRPPRSPLAWGVAGRARVSAPWRSRSLPGQVRSARSPPLPQKSAPSLPLALTS